MEEDILRSEINYLVGEADLNELKDIYHLIANYFGDKAFGNWDSMPEHLKESILKGLEEADAGLGTPAAEVIQKTSEKYGLK